METFVSIITPCRNEEKFISKCLNSIISNDYPKDKLEILVIDGKSTDRTRQIVKEYAQKYSFIKLLDNPKRIQTFATNIGLKIAKGNIVIRMDAHAEYPSDYISKSIYWLQKSEADCVGGILITKPGANSLIARAIALCLSHTFGVGNAYYRTGLIEPKYVDTVPYGCYKKEVFEKIGFFNENLDRTDDIEFNLRLGRSQGRILLIPKIKSYYYARSNLIALARQHFGTGFWMIYSLKFAKTPFSLRHLVPLAFVLSLLCSFLLSVFYKPFLYLFFLIIGVYFTTNIILSLKISFQAGFKLLPYIIATFLTLHFSYGFGSIWGAVRLVMPKGKKNLSCVI